MSVSEWDQRQLCPDGSCTGLIGSDGLCKVCGRVAPNWGDERQRGLKDEDSADANANDELGADADDDDDEYEDDDEDGEYEDDDDEDEEPDDSEAGAESTKAVSTSAESTASIGDSPDADAPKPTAGKSPSTAKPVGPKGDWRTRKLCSDGSCIGVIGDDGKCKVCRKSPEM